MFAHMRLCLPERVAKGFDTPMCLWQGTPIRRKTMRHLWLHRFRPDQILKGFSMPKAEWGKKRICPTTGKRFYDLNANPIVSPYTGQIVTIDLGKSRTMVADAEDAQTKKLKVVEDEDDLLLDDEEAEEDADLGDEVLEDEDDDDVSFDELADVAADDDDR
jgi:uncharacterized protein (TIGR02300 family)